MFQGCEHMSHSPAKCRHPGLVVAGPWGSPDPWWSCSFTYEQPAPLCWVKDTLQSQVACGNSTSKPTMVEVEYPLSYFDPNSSPCCEAQQNGREKGSVLLHLRMVCLINSRAKNFDGLGKFMPSLCVLWMFCS